MLLGVHLNLDDAWETGVLGLRELDLRQWGPRLRYCARPADVRLFARQVVDGVPPFVLYGSGDFHYLTTLFVQRMPCPVILVSFDNHPDWDRRPPRWSCGGWARRALESGTVERLDVWGCGNFELRFPGRLFADRAMLRAGRLGVHAWAERHDPRTQRKFGSMTRENWRTQFDRFVHRHEGRAVYVTVDLDCLRAGEAVTNWENGLFTAADLAWAITRLRERCQVLGGDVCGAYSPPRYARWGQRVAGRWDHPTQPSCEADRVRQTNHEALERVWPALTAARGPV